MVGSRLKNDWLVIKNTLRENVMFRNRLWIAAGLIILLTSLIIARLLYLQVFQYQHFKTLSKHNEIEVVPIPPKRGIIYDRNGIILAQNISVFGLFINPDKVDDLQTTVTELGHVISLDENDLKQFYSQIQSYRRFSRVPLKLKLDESEVARFSLEQYRFPGVSVKAGLVRYYPFSAALAHVIGYVGRINEFELNHIDNENYAATNFIGKIGIEKYYEDLLHGKVGYKNIETDAHGQPIRDLQQVSPMSGNDIYLTIDAHLQLAAEKALTNNRGAIVVIQPATGEILAMASQPAYDPNIFINNVSQQNYLALQKDKFKPLYNRSVRGLYAPGSTLKPFIALAGLEEKVITPQFALFDPGWYQLPNVSHIYHDWKHQGHGWVNLSKAIIESCDTYFYDLSHRLGIKRLDDFLSQFGFGALTHIDLIEELSGTLPTPEWKMQNRGENWYSGDTVITGIGQGYFQTTPLQLAVATAQLANRGIAFRPHLLYAVHAPNQSALYIHPEILSHVQLKKQTYWDIVISAMAKVTSQGTGHRFGRKIPYTIASKTGTAQVISRTYNPARDKISIPREWRTNSVFIAFAPVKKPQVAIAVVVEHNNVAIPLARTVLDYYFENIAPRSNKISHAASLTSKTKDLIK